LLDAGMAPQMHDPGRAARLPRGEYSQFEHKLRDRWGELRDATSAALSRSDKEAFADIAVCVSCAQPIERERLEAHPTANRCAACQRAYEHDHVTTPTPKL
jgi:RNA polymerase-binding transcription factor DksA